MFGARKTQPRNRRGNDRKNIGRIFRRRNRATRNGHRRHMACRGGLHHHAATFDPALTSVSTLFTFFVPGYHFRQNMWTRRVDPDKLYGTSLTK